MAVWKQYSTVYTLKSNSHVTVCWGSLLCSRNVPPSFGFSSIHFLFVWGYSLNLTPSLGFHLIKMKCRCLVCGHNNKRLHCLTLSLSFFFSLSLFFSVCLSSVGDLVLHCLSLCISPPPIHNLTTPPPPHLKSFLSLSVSRPALHLTPTFHSRFVASLSLGSAPQGWPLSVLPRVLSRNWTHKKVTLLQKYVG